MKKHAQPEKGEEVKQPAEYPLGLMCVGCEALVQSLSATGAMRKRFLELGLIEGTRVACLHRSPSGNPAAFLIRGAVIALRNEDAAQVLVRPC